MAVDIIKLFFSSVQTSKHVIQNQEKFKACILRHVQLQNAKAGKTPPFTVLQPSAIARV